MKTILSKFRYLLIFVMLLVGVAGAFADDDSTNPPITFQNVKAGTLRSLITRPERVTNLKLSGELNADDIMFIREMAACLKVDTIKGKEKKYRCDGHLQHLDISDVTLVPGTMKLWLDNWSYSPYIHKDGISYVFADLQSLQTIKLPNSLIRIGYYCFKNCRALVSITLPSELKNFYQFSVEGCSKLASIVTDESNSYFSSEGSVLFNKDKTEIVCAVNLTDYAVPSSVLKIGSYAFYGCSGLTSLTLPSGLTEIGESAFSNCI